MAKRPDFNLCVKPKEGPGVNTKIGVAWSDEQGRFSIKLNPCVVLSHADDVWISLYPADYQEQSRQKHYPNPKPPAQDNFDYGPPPMTDDDVPF